MRIRRCALLWVESCEDASFSLDDLLSGGAGIVGAMRWLAHAPHLDAPVEVDMDDLAMLGGYSPHDWVEDATAPACDVQRRAALLLAGLLVSDGGNTASAADARVRSQHWFGASAIAHMASRWRGLDAAREVAEAKMDSAEALRARYGPPPPAVLERAPPATRIALEKRPPGRFDALLAARATCRNFDPEASLELAHLAGVLQRVFHAQGQVHAADGFDVLKKHSPSGGALHPTEAYLVVQRVDGLAPGLYHYHATAHALEPLPGPDDIGAFARLAVAGQHWFSAAPVLVVMAPRFARNAWKYRNHAKSYRTVILDIGHLSQTLYLAATDLGLGAFVTAAINEVDIEQALGLHGDSDGPLAVAGFGRRAAHMQRIELDPNHAAWPID